MTLVTVVPPGKPVILRLRRQVDEGAVEARVVAAEDVGHAPDASVEHVGDIGVSRVGARVEDVGYVRVRGVGLAGVVDLGVGRGRVGDVCVGDARVGDVLIARARVLRARVRTGGARRVAPRFLRERHVEAVGRVEVDHGAAVLPGRERTVRDTRPDCGE